METATRLVALSHIHPPLHIVVMGVSGCGKSSLAALLASDRALPLIEGDDHHSEINRTKMRSGVPLTDEDREHWLGRLADALVGAPGGAVVTCSALKRRYRDKLRSAVPALRFAFLAIDREQAYSRVLARPHHYFSPKLVDSQFDALEVPTGEPGVLALDGQLPLVDLMARVSAWLDHGGHFLTANGDPA